MCSTDTASANHPPPTRAILHDRLKELTGLEDTSGVEIIATLRGLTRLCEVVESRRAPGLDLSGPRWGLLMLLMAHERYGKKEGLTPTALSHIQGVSKNSISSLLRGLEEQGYIERTLDEEDRRVFRIRLTDLGRQVVQSSAPGWVAYINRLAAGLSPEEREQLLDLLDKLHHSIVAQAGLCGAPCSENGQD